MRLYVDNQGFVQIAGPISSSKSGTSGSSKTSKSSPLPPQRLVKGRVVNNEKSRSQKASLQPYEETVFDPRHPLHQAIAAGKIDRVASLIRQKPARLHIRAHDGITPLHYAVLKGHLRIVQMLRAKGASPTAADKWGQTPLHIAKALGAPEYIKALNPSAKSITTPNQRPNQRPHNPPVRASKAASDRAVQQLPDVSAPLLAAADGLVFCPYCNVKVRKDRLRRHIARIHSGGSDAPHPTPPKRGQTVQEVDVEMAPNVLDGWESDTIRDGSYSWGYAWRDNGSYGSHPGFDGMDDESDAG